MEEYAVRFAELLEQVAARARALTVDRVARGIRLAALGIVAGSLLFIALVLLLLAIFGALEIPLTTAGAFALIGAVLVVTGGVLWWKRS